MRRSRFTAEQIIGILGEQETGVTTAEVCRKHGISQATFYAWKTKYGGMSVSDAARLKQLEAESTNPNGAGSARDQRATGLPDPYSRSRHGALPPSAHG